MKQAFIWALLLIIVVATSRAQTVEENLQHSLDSISKQDGLAGFGVSVFTLDTILFQGGFGYADLENKRPYTVKTVQNIGSISKTFTGVALMKAVAMGKLTMDTPINKILPFEVRHPKYPEQQITIRYLATHTSGIIDLEKTYDKSYVIENPEAVDPNIYNKEIAKYMHEIVKNKPMALGDYLKAYLSEEGSLYSKKNFLKTAPGERYEYSNIASALAAHCVEIVTGVPFHQFTQNHIFDKIGMDEAGWFLDSVFKESHAEIYSDNMKILPRYELVTYPDGGLRTNVASLTKYMQVMMGCYEGRKSIISQRSCQEMMKGQLTKSQVGVEGVDDNYGFFWERVGENTIGHNGADPGILTLMYYNTEMKVGAIFFTNTNVIDNPKAAQLVQQSWNAIRAYRSKKVE